ncbi:hypothetical protein Lal_00009772 [Lupinus albus]|nr:hypothetical protein Lal_00009772 [Lupinus albus]
MHWPSSRRREPIRLHPARADRNGPDARRGHERGPAGAVQVGRRQDRGGRLRYGYSSLSYLSQFPIDVLKIDQSFVRAIDGAGGKNGAIVGAVIDMGRNLHQRVIAEGVEDEEQLAFLKAHECNEGQGYLFSRPVDAVLMQAMFGTGIPDVAAQYLFDGVHVGITGRDDHREVGEGGARVPHQLGPRHAGHQVIRDHEVRLALVEHDEAGFAVRRLRHLVAERLERGHHRGAYRIVVLDDQDARRRDRMQRAVRQRRLVRHVIAGARGAQPDFDRGAGTRCAEDARETAGLLRHAVDLGQAEPRALADFLGREEGLEHPRHQVGRDAGAGIGHGQADVVAVRRQAVRRRAQGRLEAQVAAAVHGVARIDRQVEQRHLQLVGIGHHARARGVHGEVQAHAGAQRRGQQFAHAAEQGRDVDGTQVQVLVARERQQLAGQLAAALAGTARDLRALLRHLVLRHQEDQVHAALDHVQEVVEIVGDAARQAPDGFHLLELHHRQLHALAFDDFVHQAVVGLGQRTRAFLDACLQRLVQVQQRGLALFQPAGGAAVVGQDVARLELAAPCAQGRSGGAAQRARVQGPFEQDDVAQVAQAGTRVVRRQADRVRDQDDEGEVGPRFLLVEPGTQARQVGAVQRFLGDDRRAGAAHDLVAQRREGGHDRARVVVGRIDRPVGRHHRRGAPVAGQPGQHAVEPFERQAHAHAVRAEAQLVDAERVVRRAALDDGDGAVQAAVRFEKAQQDRGVAQVAQVDVVADFADQSVLAEHQHGRDALLVQVRQELVHLQRQELLARHRLQVGVQAVDGDEGGALFLHRVAQHLRELAGRQFGRVDMIDQQPARFHEGPQRHPERGAAGVERGQALVEQVERRGLAALQRRQQAARRQRGLADAGRADDQAVGAARQPAAQQGVQLGRAGRAHLGREVARVFGRHQAREHGDPARLQDVVVVAAAEADAAHLDDVHAAALLAEFLGDLVEADDPVRDAVQVLVRCAGLVVEQEDGAAARGEELLQRQDLAAVAQRILRQQAHFRQAVEHDAGRPDPVDLVHHVARRLAQLHFGGVEDRLLRIRVEHQVAGQLEDLEAVDRPAVARGDGHQFVRRFRQRDVQPAFAARRAVEQELQAQRGLARAGRTLDEVDALRCQAAAENIVEAGNAGGNPGTGGWMH